MFINLNYVKVLKYMDCITLTECWIESNNINFDIKGFN